MLKAIVSVRNKAGRSGLRHFTNCWKSGSLLAWSPARGPWCGHWPHIKVYCAISCSASPPILHGGSEGREGDEAMNWGASAGKVTGLSEHLAVLQGLFLAPPPGVCGGRDKLYRFFIHLILYSYWEKRSPLQMDEGMLLIFAKNDKWRWCWLGSSDSLTSLTWAIAHGNTLGEGVSVALGPERPHPTLHCILGSQSEKLHDEGRDSALWALHHHSLMNTPDKNKVFSPAKVWA